MSTYLCWIPDERTLQDSYNVEHDGCCFGGSSAKSAAERAAAKYWRDCSPDYPDSVYVVVMSEETGETAAFTVDVELEPRFYPTKASLRQEGVAELIVSGLIIAVGGPDV